MYRVFHSGGVSEISTLECDKYLMDNKIDDAAKNAKAFAKKAVSLHFYQWYLAQFCHKSVPGPQNKVGT